MVGVTGSSSTSLGFAREPWAIARRIRRILEVTSVAGWCES